MKHNLHYLEMWENNLRVINDIIPIILRQQDIRTTDEGVHVCILKAGYLGNYEIP